ncbi:MAG: alpha/beta hydrolase [Candidatus Dojkabacteria bacterium]
MNKIFKKKNIKYFAGGFAILMLLGVSIFLIWTNNPYKPQTEALDSLVSTKDYIVTEGDFLTFQPTKDFNSGVIFYPGGGVDARAYAPLCQYLAEEQHLCVIVKMPLNLAIFGIEKADEVRNQFQDIHYWVLAGHSLGGSMAAKYVKNHINDSDIKGLSLLAAYSDLDISSANILITSFRGTNDGVFSKQTWDNTRGNLPSKYSTFTEIPGGNHSQFGYYGFQAGDNEATISHEEQFRIFEQGIHDMMGGH